MLIPLSRSSYWLGARSGARIARRGRFACLLLLGSLAGGYLGHPEVASAAFSPAISGRCSGTFCGWARRGHSAAATNATIAFATGKWGIWTAAIAGMHRGGG